MYRIEALMNRSLTEIPADIADAIERKDIILTPFENINDILKNESLQQEAG